MLHSIPSAPTFSLDNSSSDLTNEGETLETVIGIKVTENEWKWIKINSFYFHTILAVRIYGKSVIKVFLFCNHQTHINMWVYVNFMWVHDHFMWVCVNFMWVHVHFMCDSCSKVPDRWEMVEEKFYLDVLMIKRWRMSLFTLRRGVWKWGSPPAGNRRNKTPADLRPAVDASAAY